MNLGGAIKRLRKEKGLKQKELAESAGISQPYLCLVEKNKKTPYAPTLIQIAKGLETPLAILFYYSLEEEDIASEKQKIYQIIKPMIDGLIGQLK